MVLPISRVEHAELEKSLLFFTCIPLQGREPPKCKADNWLETLQGWFRSLGVFQQECCVSVPYFRLLPEMSLQFRKCSLSDGFDNCVVSVFDSQLAGLVW